MKQVRNLVKETLILFLAVLMFLLAPTRISADEADDVARRAAEQDIEEFENAYAEQLIPQTITSAEDAYETRLRYTREMAVQAAYDVREKYVQDLEWKTGIRGRVVNYALSWVGVTPYVWAGGSLWYGTDCSGFVHLIYQAFGYNLPTGSDAYQYNVGYHIAYEDLLPGDIIVYGYGAHVGIYVGEGLVCHCSSPENGTVVWNMLYRTPTAYLRVF